MQSRSIRSRCPAARVTRQQFTGIYLSDVAAESFVVESSHDKIGRHN